MHFIMSKPRGKVGACLRTPAYPELQKNYMRGIKNVLPSPRGKSFCVITLDTRLFTIENESSVETLIIFSIASRAAKS